MDVKLINPFLQSFNTVMPQLGFEVERGEISMKEQISASGITISVGLTGDVKGNVIYILSEEGGKGIASKMMMGMEVETLDDMAKSALSEMSNMLTANASINYSKQGIETDISTPVLVTGDKMNIKVNTDKIVCVEMKANGIPIEINISLE